MAKKTNEGNLSHRATAAFAQTPAAQLAADDAVRIREFYRLASQIQNRLERDACTIVTPN